MLEDLKYVFQTKNDVIVLTSSGTGGMEAAVSNVLAPGEKAILLTAGRWGERWRGILKGFGVNVVSVEVPYGKAVPPAQLEEALAKHPDAVAVFATLSETGHRRRPRHRGVRQDRREDARRCSSWTGSAAWGRWSAARTTGTSTSA